MCRLIYSGIECVFIFFSIPWFSIPLSFLEFCLCWDITQKPASTKWPQFHIGWFVGYDMIWMTNNDRIMTKKNYLSKEGKRFGTRVILPSEKALTKCGFNIGTKLQSWALLVFLKFFYNKKWLFAFFIKLIIYFCTSPI